MAKIEISKNIPLDLEPDEKTTLWRYMSFSSLCEILMNDYIPLIPIQHFSDKSEGRVLKGILSKLPNANESAIELIMQVYKEATYVSSWYRAENENAAMWDRYTYKGEGVAVKTNAKLLLYSIANANRRALGEPTTEITLPSNIIIKEIKYKNYQPSDFEATQEQLLSGYDKLCFFYKMDDYEDEKEVRILISLLEGVSQLYETSIRSDYRQIMVSSLKSSMPLRIESSDNLIEKIIVSPHSHSQFIKTVRQTIEKINTYRQLDGLPKFQVSKVVGSRRKDWV